MAYEESFPVSWAHLDGNAHMANTAYMLVAIDCRFHYFASRGVTPAEFARWRIGPAVRRDEIDYFREMHLMQVARVNLLLAGLAADASRFRIVNEIHRPDGVLAARVTSVGGWLDLEARKLVAPPEPLAAALRDLERLPDFEVLPSSIR
ncbi:MAG TPA: thioesterase family protein [Usitatibacteraceae bacterium]|nr:thioesterase family protein [Usitatibacteraceae bacterium]